MSMNRSGNIEKNIQAELHMRTLTFSFAVKVDISEYSVAVTE